MNGRLNGGGHYLAIRKVAKHFLILWVVALGLAMPVWAKEATLRKFTVIPLKNGINRVDLNGDGVMDMVMKSRRDNFNAHGYSIYSFFVELRNETVSGNKWHTVQITDDDRKFRNDTKTWEGADCILADIRLVREKDKPDHTVTLIYGKRSYSESYYEKNKVTFVIYRLMKNKDGRFGWPEYYFLRNQTIEGKEKYCDINRAFEKELGLK